MSRIKPRDSRLLTDLDVDYVHQRLSCPTCRTSFADFFYLKEGLVDRYLATAEQVRNAGFGRYLAPHLQPAGDDT